MKSAANNAPTPHDEEARIALVHDYLTQYGGAERVLEELHDMLGHPPVFSSVLEKESLPDSFQRWDIQETDLGRLPAVSSYHRALVPLYPRAFRRLSGKLSAFNLVVADSSAWSHHAVAADNATLVCYCHSPARFLYGDSSYLGPAGLPTGVRQVVGLAFATMRRKDQQAAQRVDRFVANSRNVARRILRAYGRKVSVVYPPVDVDRFRPAQLTAAEDWYLVVSRLVPHKRIDLAIEAATRYGFPLKVIGEGRSLDELQKRAGHTVEFLGACDDASVASHLQRCKAMILPGQEDFGITAVEAQAAGRPVVAYGRGGALETVLPGRTGMIFWKPTVESLMSAVDHIEQSDWDSGLAMRNAERFRRERFRAEMWEEIAAAIRSRERSINSRG